MKNKNRRIFLKRLKITNENFLKSNDFDNNFKIHKKMTQKSFYSNFYIELGRGMYL